MMEIEKNKCYKYIELCRYFGEDAKSGSSKTAQIKRWRRVMDIEHICYGRYLIKEKTTKEIFDVLYEDRHKAGIYKIYNPTTKEIYIGQTKDFKSAFGRNWRNENGKYIKGYTLLHNGGAFSVLEFDDDASSRKDKCGDYIEYYRNKDGYICYNNRDYKVG